MTQHSQYFFMNCASSWIPLVFCCLILFQYEKLVSEHGLGDENKWMTESHKQFLLKVTDGDREILFSLSPPQAG